MSVAAADHAKTERWVPGRVVSVGLKRIVVQTATLAADVLVSKLRREHTFVIHDEVEIQLPLDAPHPRSLIWNGKSIFNPTSTTSALAMRFVRHPNERRFLVKITQYGYYFAHAIILKARDKKGLDGIPHRIHIPRHAYDGDFDHLAVDTEWNCRALLHANETLPTERWDCWIATTCKSVLPDPPENELSTSYSIIIPKPKYANDAFAQLPGMSDYGQVVAKMDGGNSLELSYRGRRQPVALTVTGRLFQVHDIVKVTCEEDGAISDLQFVLRPPLFILTGRVEIRSGKECIVSELQLHGNPREAAASPRVCRFPTAMFWECQKEVILRRPAPPAGTTTLNVIRSLPVELHAAGLVNQLPTDFQPETDYWGVLSIVKYSQQKRKKWALPQQSQPVASATRPSRKQNNAARRPGV